MIETIFGLACVVGIAARPDHAAVFMIGSALVFGWSAGRLYETWLAWRAVGRAVRRERGGQ